MNNPATTNPPPYLLSSMFNTRYHQHLNHLNDMAFTHTKILQDIIDKRATEPAAVSPHGSLSSSSSSSSASSMHSQPSRKRAYPSPDETKGDSPTNKRPRKQSKPQHVTRVDKNGLEQSASSSSEDDEPMPDSHLSFQSALPPAHVPFPQHSSPLMAHLTSPISMSKFLENLHKELFSSAMQGKRMPGPVPPTFFSPTAPHPYYSQVLFNNHFPSPSFLNRFPGPSPHDPRSYSFHFSAPKKRRTKVILLPTLWSRIDSRAFPGHRHSSLASHQIQSAPSPVR